MDGKKIKQTDIDLIFAKSKPANERRLSLENFMGNAITNVAKMRYPWLETEGEGINNPAARQFIKEQVFHWEECAELVWMVCRNNLFIFSLYLRIYNTYIYI